MEKEPLTTATQRNFLRARLSILSAVCSLERDDPSNCAFLAVREMSDEGRIAWIDALGEETAQNIYISCRFCWKAKRYLKEQKHTNFDPMPLIEAKMHGSPYELTKK
jgi:hypothetical protein